jgi:hypothetical protein
VSVRKRGRDLSVTLGLYLWLRPRQGALHEAVQYLGRAVDAGYSKVEKHRTDPGLAPLRSRREFRELLACIDS